MLLRRHMSGETRNAADGLGHGTGGNQSRTFKMSGSPGMAGAPEKIMMVKAMFGVIPARITAVPVNHPVWCRKFVGRMGKTADQDNRSTGGPCEPG